MDRQFIAERVTYFQNIITQYENAMIALQNPAIQEYMIDTGQTKQRVVRADIVNLQKTLDGLYNQYSVWCGRLNGGQTTIVRPSW